MPIDEPKNQLATITVPAIAATLSANILAPAFTGLLFPSFFVRPANSL